MFRFFGIKSQVIAAATTTSTVRACCLKASVANLPLLLHRARTSAAVLETDNLNMEKCSSSSFTEPVFGFLYAVHTSDYCSQAATVGDICQAESPEPVSIK
ncbi:hypothetical protein T265_01648 [Opisthorchis viverrini]|uniref:Uncharacterized protein n=1 Tax=Opisthorchis viverrini TaxID=6198 RepID=A0A075AIT9_OPIVI|nr:hypothetical protein T265_01648 [Opisthorchis viverrini]KER32214.1 hypothetical protein T265_01648 [Opisthorchis viverrini]